MINTEILAIIAIFLAGLYIGLKLKESIENLKEYLRNNKN